MAFRVVRRVRAVLLLMIIASVGLLASTVFRTDAAAQPGAPSGTSVVLTEGSLLSFDLSPDGRWIVLDVTGQIWRIPSTGGRAEALTDALRDTADYREPFFSPDGTTLLLTADVDDVPAFWTLDLDTRALRRVPGQAVDLRFWNTFPRSWSPDGRRYVYSQYVRDPDTRRAVGKLHVAHARSGEVELLDTRVDGTAIMARDPA